MQALSKLRLIAEKAKQHKAMKFTSLMHIIDEELLSECYKMLKKRAASGIDGITVKAYGDNLTHNIKRLVERLKSKTYKSRSVRRVYIPKPGKTEPRPLGIPCVEDKLVQMAAKLILDAIYEPVFKDSSHGFRPNRGCITAVKQLNCVVMKSPVNYVVEVDIAKFFDSVNHYWLQRCLEERIEDPNFLWLIRRFLKAGIMEDGQSRTSDEGTPQGGVISPILANIYLHYVLDLWVEKVIKPKARGSMKLIRYCDDFVVTCESPIDANKFLKELKERLAKFGLEISQEKTKILKFGRKAWKYAQSMGRKVETFDFLGFTHYCMVTRKGWFAIGHKTSGQRLRRKLQGINQWLCQVRNAISLDDWWPKLAAKLNGHYSYYGVNGNMRSLKKFYYQSRRLAFKWINKRSQKKSMNWEQFNEYLEWNPLPSPRIVHHIWS